MATTTESALPVATPEMGTASEALRDSAQQSAITIASCSHAMNRLAGTSGTIAEEASQVAQQASEIRDAAQLTLREAQEAESKANELREDAIRGQKSLGSIAQQMAGAAQQAEQAQTTIRALNSAIQAIEAAATAIGQIAPQTRLLALNASIEAARAGKSARGSRWWRPRFGSWQVPAARQRAKSRQPLPMCGERRSAPPNPLGPWARRCNAPRHRCNKWETN